MREEGKTYCDTSKVSVREISKSIAKDIIVKNHYSHAWTMCRYALGVFYKSENGSFFDDEQLIGCLVYGYPVGRRAAASISDELKTENVLELTRLYVDDGYGSNIESYAISQSFRWFRENDTNIKALLSYADNGQEHLGKIYQATNWIYQGLNTDMNLMPTHGISLTNNPYKWIHSRTVGSYWVSHNIEKLREAIGKEGYTEFWRKKESGKHRYIQVLGKDKKERKFLMNSLKHPSKPYPKDVREYDSEIEHYTTIPPDSEKGFW